MTYCNKTMLFIFHHGWGQDASYFMPFAKKLLEIYPAADFIHLDNKYFFDFKCDTENYTEKLMNFDKNQYKLIVGVGHSIGLSKLIQIQSQLNLQFHVIFSFAGFVSYNNSKLDQIALEMTIKAFKSNPREMLSSFVKRDIVENINYELLMLDLQSLLLLNVAPSILSGKFNSKLFHIYGLRDSILGSVKSINKVLKSDVFTERAIDTSSHYLPYHYEEDCIEFVKTSLDNIYVGR